MIIDIEDLSVLENIPYINGERRITYIDYRGKIYSSTTIFLSGCFYQSPKLIECVNILDRLGYTNEILRDSKRYVSDLFYIDINVHQYRCRISSLPPFSNGMDVFRCTVGNFIEYCNE